MSSPNATKQEIFSRPNLPHRSEEGSKALFESLPEITSEGDMAFSRSVLCTNAHGNLELIHVKSRHVEINCKRTILNIYVVFLL